jgi:hypothetical protein
MKKTTQRQNKRKGEIFMIAGAILTIIDENQEERSIILSAEQLQIIIDTLGIMPSDKEDEIKMWSNSKLKIMHLNGIKEISDLISRPNVKTVIESSDSDFGKIKIVNKDIYNLLNTSETAKI